MKQTQRLLPLIRPKLPTLPRRHHTNHPIPRVRPELAQHLRVVDDVVRLGRRGFASGGVDGGAFAVEGDEVFGAGVAFGEGAGAGGGGGFEAERRTDELNGRTPKEIERW